MSFELEKYQRASTKYRAEWEATDEALYSLCQRYPGHQDRGGINAKLLIIGRAYATGIERKIPSLGTQGSSLEQLADHLTANGSTADRVFGDPICKTEESGGGSRWTAEGSRARNILTRRPATHNQTTIHAHGPRADAFLDPGRLTINDAVRSQIVGVDPGASVGMLATGGGAIPKEGSRGRRK